MIFYYYLVLGATTLVATVQESCVPSNPTEIQNGTVEVKEEIIPPQPKQGDGSISLHALINN